jgi:plastocyanin
MRTLLLALVIALVAAAPAAARTRNVKVGDNFFRARSITVHKGTIVRWNWIGTNAHDVAVRRGPRRFHSAVKTRGHFSRRLRRRGTYKIVCRIHAPRMRMRIRVT